MKEIKITNTNGVLTVSSLQIARDFEKRHDHVVRDIETLINFIDNFSHSSILRNETSTGNSENLTPKNSAVTMRIGENLRNLTPQNWGMKNFFIESSYINERGREYKCYDITRDGFALLVMGFTGTKALAWKLRYIETFNNMERQLININTNIEEIVNRALDEKLKTIVEPLEQKINILDNKIDAIEKNSDDRTNNVIEKIEKSIIETSYMTSKALIPCFEYMYKKLKKIYKNMKGKI